MSYRVHIEKKSRDLLPNGPVALKILKDIGAQKRWVRPEELTRAGLPMDLSEPVLLHLSSRIRADVEAKEGGLRFFFHDLNQVPLALRFPARFQRLIHRVWHVSAHAGSSLIGLGASATGAFIMMYYVLLVANFMPESGFRMALFVALVLIGGVIAIPVLIVVLFCGLLYYALATVFAALVSGGSIHNLPAFFVGLFAVTVLYVNFMHPAFLKWSKDLVPRLEAPLNFGQRRREALDDEKAFMDLVLARDGVVGLGDLMVLFGWTRQQAFKELTRLMLDYGGDVRVDDDGRIDFIFEPFETFEPFEPFESVAPSRPVAEPQPVWVRERRPAEVFDKEARRFDVRYLAFWLLGILMPAFSTLGVAGLKGSTPSAIGMAVILLLPLYVPIRRMIVAWRDAKYSKRRRYLDVLQEFSAGNGELVRPMNFVETELLVDLGGDVLEEMAEGDNVVFRAPELRRAKVGALT